MIVVKGSSKKGASKGASKEPTPADAFTLHLAARAIKTGRGNGLSGGQR